MSNKGPATPGLPHDVEHSMSGFSLAPERRVGAWMAAALIAGLGSIDVAAHGGLEMDKDVCKLKIGPYAMHFAGYQPRATGTQEFCEDIPQTGETMVTLDVLDDPLRTMPIEIRVLREPGDSNLEPTTLVHMPPALYPTGIVPFAYRFEEPGRYVGVVMAGEKGQYVSRFPFRVGASTSKWSSYLPLLGVLLGSVALYFYSGYRQQRARNVRRSG